MVRTHSMRGFSLIELLLVLLIISALAGLFIAVMGRTPEKTKIKTTTTLVETVVPQALERFYADMDRYPTEEEGLAALVKAPAFEDENEAKKYGGPYLKKVPVDGWGQELHYEPVDPGSGTDTSIRYKVWSDGPNKQSGDDDDIRSWSEEESST